MSYTSMSNMCGRWHYEVSSRGLYISASAALLPATSMDSTSGRFHSATMPFLCSRHLQHSAAAHGGVGFTFRVSLISLPQCFFFLYYPSASPHDLTPFAFCKLRKHLLNNARFCHQLKCKQAPLTTAAMTSKCQDG